MLEWVSCTSGFQTLTAALTSYTLRNVCLAISHENIQLDEGRVSLSFPPSCSGREASGKPEKEGDGGDKKCHNKGKGGKIKVAKTRRQKRYQNLSLPQKKGHSIYRHMRLVSGQKLTGLWGGLVPPCFCQKRYPPSCPVTLRAVVAVPIC